MRPRLSSLDIAAGIRVPRGEDGYWEIILDLDRIGPWTVRQIAMRTNVSSQQIADFVKRLRLGGIAVAIDTKVNGRVADAIIYRLTRRPRECPRLRKDGSPRPEQAREQMWRAMKMLRHFTLAELVEACDDVTAGGAGSYCWNLVQVGVLAKIGATFRLINNLGAQAPKVLHAQLVFDPNAKAIVGRALAREVRP